MKAVTRYHILYDSWNRQSSKDRYYIRDCLLLRWLGGNGEWLLIDTGFVLVWWKYSKIGCCNGYITVNTVKTTELYILNGWVVWYVNISQRSCFKKAQNYTTRLSEEHGPSRYLLIYVFIWSSDVYDCPPCTKYETGTLWAGNSGLAHPCPWCLELCLAQRLWLSPSPHLPHLQDFSLASSKVILFLSCHTVNCLLNFLTGVKRKNNLGAWIFVICGII